MPTHHCHQHAVHIEWNPLTFMTLDKYLRGCSLVLAVEAIVVQVFEGLSMNRLAHGHIGQRHDRSTEASSIHQPSVYHPVLFLSITF